MWVAARTVVVVLDTGAGCVEPNGGLCVVQAPDWTLQEFETLINLPAVPAGELSRLLGTRTAAAIEAMRGVVHAYHGGARDHPALTPALHRYLDQRGGFIVCAQCGAATNLDLA